MRSLGPKVENEKTVFVYKVSYLQSHPFIIKDRYSNIKKLYQELKKKQPNFKKNFKSTFPTESFFSGDFIEKRDVGLEFFFHELLNTEEYV